MGSNDDLCNARVLVTGATGFLGSHLVTHLSSIGVHVVALVRRPECDCYIRDLPGIEIAEGDITNLAQMYDVIKPGIDYVFHVAAALSGSLEYQHQINVDGTVNVLRACTRADVKRLVYVSSIAVYGYKHQAKVVEESVFTASTDAYAMTKQEAERCLVRVAQDTGLKSYSIIRPGMIYGPRAVMWTKNAMRLAALHPTPWLGRGDGLCYPIFVDDVIKQMLLQAILPEAHNETFNATPDPSPTWREYLGAYKRLTGKTGWLPLPYRLIYAWSIAWVLPFSLVFRKGLFLIDMIRYTQSTVTYSMDKARIHLGWEPEICLSHGVRQCIPYLHEKGLLD